MDASHVLEVTAGSGARQDGGALNGSSQSPQWPPGCPTRQAVSYLEQALTTGVPRPCYDGPVRRVVMPDGTSHIDQAFTLALEHPLHTAHFAPPMASDREPDVLGACHAFSPDSPASSVCDNVNVSPAPGFKASLLNTPSLIPTVDPRNVQARDRQAHNALRETTSVQSTPHGASSRPELRGILLKSNLRQIWGGSTEPEAQVEAVLNERPQDNPGGPRRAVRFKLPQELSESGYPQIVDARPRFVVTVKSRAAARKWHELELKRE